jgi:hypothetical protein
MAAMKPYKKIVGLLSFWESWGQDPLFVPAHHWVRSMDFSTGLTPCLNSLSSEPDTCFSGTAYFAIKGRSVHKIDILKGN